MLYYIVFWIFRHCKSAGYWLPEFSDSHFVSGTLIPMDILGSMFSKISFTVSLKPFLGANPQLIEARFRKVMKGSSTYRSCHQFVLKLRGDVSANCVSRPLRTHYAQGSERWWRVAWPCSHLVDSHQLAHPATVWTRQCAARAVPGQLGPKGSYLYRLGWHLHLLEDAAPLYDHLAPGRSRGHTLQVNFRCAVDEKCPNLCM